MPTEVLPCGTKLSRYGMNQPLDTALLSLDFSFAQDTRSITGLLPSGGPRTPIRNAAQLPWICRIALWRAGLTALRMPPECICTSRVCALDSFVHLMSSFSLACLRRAIFWAHVLGRLFSHTCSATVAGAHQALAWIGLPRSSLILPAPPFDAWWRLLRMLRRLTKGGCEWGGRSDGHRPRRFVSGSSAACTCGRRVQMLHIAPRPQRRSSVMWRAVTSLIWLTRACR